MHFNMGKPKSYPNSSFILVEIRLLRVDNFSLLSLMLLKGSIALKSMGCRSLITGVIKVILLNKLLISYVI